MTSLEKFYDALESSLADGKVRPFHYGIAVAAVAAAVALKFALELLFHHHYTLILFYPAIVVAAWLGGLGPGLLATFLSGGLSILFLTVFKDAGPADTGSLVIFTIFSVLICFLMDAMHFIVSKSRKLYRQVISLNQDLYQQREWFRITLTSIGDAVVVTDRNGKIDFMNGEAERLTGWNAQEAKSMPLRAIFRIVNEESRKSVDDPVEKVFRENRVVGLANHTLLISKGGAEWPIEDSASPIHDERENILGVVLVFHDATELRRNQRALKSRADELEHKVFERTVALQRTVNDLESFSYSVSHDLRSPLRAMLGYSQALLEDFPEMPKDAGDYLEKIAKSAERLDRLIQDLLAFSRISNEEETLTTVDLDRLIREILQQYPNFQDDRSKITIEGQLPVVLGHETALTQIISNLLGNAIKFTPEGRQPEVLIRADIEEHVVRVWFIDNGIGIASENYARIFKMFEQINPPGQYSGTGIGLAVVKKATEKMQGSMGVESTLGQGSKFWIELLRAKKQKHEHSHDSHS